MANAYILNDQLDAADRITIEDAVQGAGLTPVRGALVNVSSLDPNADVGVVGLPVTPGDEATVDARMQAFAGAGIRVVCIWLREEEGAGMGTPEGVGKYGTTVAIDSPDLTGTLKGETDVWEEPDGAPSPTPVTKRNKC
ncbi:hypothetical protein TW83_17560 [Paracoccus sp. S4493]|uniref:hypothetical protein n=1 Tax=Paracoccus sp. S4493 TaxID=579490 RepID=UPI0005FA19D1|nr:hypothetical protein [Paracoccus sp. S4493]KJZ29892.1 hypothetical protein TW83_17560 [Paracoccus sp. S4493]